MSDSLSDSVTLITSRASCDAKNDTYTVLAKQERSAPRILVEKNQEKRNFWEGLFKDKVLIIKEIFNLAAGEFASLSKGAHAPDNL